MTTPSWDDAYTGSTPAAWDIGRPQPAFVRLAEQGLLAGRVLDSGCGTGEQTLLAAAHGADATGVDMSGRAIQRAREKAAERSLVARFEVGDALRLADLGLTFDAIIDSGVFHVFDDENRATYVSSLASVLCPGGRCYLACFSDRQPGTWGPRRVSQDELRAAFSRGWDVVRIEAAAFDVNEARTGVPSVSAWLAVLERNGQGLSPAGTGGGAGSGTVAGLMRRLPGHMPSRPNSATRAEPGGIRSDSPPEEVALSGGRKMTASTTAAAYPPTMRYRRLTTTKA